MELQKVYFQKLRPDARLPYRATAESAGFDLAACMDGPVEIAPGETKMIHTGVAVVLPYSTAGMVYPRSGLAVKAGVSLANCVGVIDSDYRGELMVPLYNHSGKPFTVCPGDRIAQLVGDPRPPAGSGGIPDGPAAPHKRTGDRRVWLDRHP